MEVCKYCKNSFKNIYKLRHHQKSAKYCLKIQNNIKKCICGCIFKGDTAYEKHIENCFKYQINQIELKMKTEYEKTIGVLKDTIKDQDHQINKLQNKLEDFALKIAERTPTTNNTINIIQNLQPIQENNFVDNLDYLTIDYIKKGAPGYAQYALEYPLKNKIICVDYARRKVKFKDNDGNIITDPEMTNLATKFFESIKDKNKVLINEHESQLKEKFGDDDITKIVKLFEMDSEVSKAANGEKGDFHQEFEKNVCSKTIV